MYIGSKQHLDNLAKARKKAIEKVACQFCGRMIAKCSIKKHEKSCERNPETKTLFSDCPVCGKRFKIKSNGKVRTTCSHSCANVYFRSGINHPNWKDSSYRTTCFHFHEKKCIICGENNIVEVHHNDGNRNNNKPENLVPLCPTHHRYVHSKYNYLVSEQIEKYIVDFKKQKECET